MTKKNVLLVEDEYVFNYLTTTIINKMGFAEDIRIALNGRDALELILTSLREHTPMPDLILLDLNMPIMTGFEFLREYEKMNFEGKDKIHIAIVTSSTDLEDIKTAQELGVRHYLNKPISEEAIYKLISQEW
ncbi:MAG: response regulator [Cytophagaceae bacterium]